MTLVIALVVTVALVVVARDVQADAARNPAHRATLNLAFAALARAVLADEHVFAQRATTLLTHGATLTRQRFGGEMDLALLEGRQVVQEADLLATPSIDDDAQAHLITVVTNDVTGVSELLSEAAATLSLPHPNDAWPGVTAIQQSLVASNSLWAGTRVALATAPGHAQLADGNLALATDPLAIDLADLAASSTLAPTRAVLIAAVEVQPPPFPAPPHVLVLPPSRNLTVDVVARNVEYINQRVTVTIVIQPIGPGFARTRTAHLSLAPLGSFAADFGRIPIAPGERARLTITLLGAPIAGHGSGVEHFTVTVSPSPTS